MTKKDFTDNLNHWCASYASVSDENLDAADSLGAYTCGFYVLAKLIQIKHDLEKTTPGKATSLRLGIPELVEFARGEANIIVEKICPGAVPGLAAYPNKIEFPGSLV